MLSIAPIRDCIVIVDNMNFVYCVEGKIPFHEQFNVYESICEPMLSIEILKSNFCDDLLSLDVFEYRDVHYQIKKSIDSIEVRRHD